MAIEPKRSTVSMDDADGEYNCISAKRRKPSLGKSRGTIDDSGWNVSNTSTWTTATQYSNSILNSTCSIHHDAKDDDASNDGEKTMCDQHLQPNAEYELKCLTPLNSLLLLSVREKSSSNISERSSAFRTANSSFDVSSRDTVNKGYDNDDEDDNRNHSRYGNYTYFQTPVSKSNKSDAFWKSSRHFNNTISHIDHVIIATTAPPDCMCDANTTDGNSLKSSMTMSVSSAEYRSTATLITSTPIMAAPIIGKDVINYDHNIFSIARVKKVELHDMTPKVPEFSEPKTPATNRMNGCNNNNNNSIKAINGNVPLITNTQASPPTSQPALQRPPQKHSNTMPAAMQSATEDGSVMKKIISLSVEQFNNIENSIGKVASTTVPQARPVFVEKLHFSAYEQFEGQMLVNWIVSTIPKHHSYEQRDVSEIQQLIWHICSNLLVAGVMKQIIDKDASLQDHFCPKLMYRWAHTETCPHDKKETPKKLDPNVLWPHVLQSSKSLTEKENGKQNHNGLGERGMSMIGPFCSDVEKFIMIKSRIKNCHSIAALCNEIRIAASELNDYSCGDDDFNLKKSKSIDCVDHVQMRSFFDGISARRRNGNNKENCDIIESVRTKNESTQTDDPIELVTVSDVRPAPMPNANIPPLQKPVSDQSSSPPPPPMPNAPPFQKSNQMPPPPPPMPGMMGPPRAPPMPNAPALQKSGQPPPPPPPPGQNQSSAASSVNGSPAPLPMPTDGAWFGTNAFRKSALIPPKPMKNLFWTRILTPTKQINETPTDEVDGPFEENAEEEALPELWHEIDETKLYNMDEFTELFSRTVDSPKVAKKLTPKKPLKVKRVKVLDCKRSQSVGIFARSLHVDFDTIERAIFHWDTSTISLETLQQLMEHRASPIELEKIKTAAAAESDTPLDEPEQFLLKLSNISCAGERISCILFQAEFDEACSAIGGKMSTVQGLCKFLIENDHLKRVFSIILTLGNFMNGGNRLRGQADGFQLDILKSLRDVKSNDPKVTLLHFIVKTYINEFRQRNVALHDIVNPVPDTVAIKQTIDTDFEQVQEQLNDLEKKIKEFEGKMVKVISASDEQNIQPFKKNAENFVAAAKERIAEQKRCLNDSKSIFKKTLKFYKYKKVAIDGEGACTLGEFFNLWQPFVIDFREIWKKQFDAINWELVQKAKATATPKSATRGKNKPIGLRMRRLNQI